LYTAARQEMRSNWLQAPWSSTA